MSASPSLLNGKYYYTFPEKFVWQKHSRICDNDEEKKSFLNIDARGFNDKAF